MRRISVVGSGSGAGKTTFGRRLAAKLGVPFVELDALAFGPNWAMLPREEFRARLIECLGGTDWVVDGNYSNHVRDLVWERADCVVWLDLSLRVLVWRTTRRTLRRLLTREVLWAGNRETLRGAIGGRRSLLGYLIFNFRSRRRRFERELAELRSAHLTVHRFRRQADADRWLASL